MVVDDVVRTGGTKVRAERPEKLGFRDNTAAIEYMLLV